MERGRERRIHDTYGDVVTGEWCEICGALHTEENFVVFEYEILICSDCLITIDEAMKENDGQGE